MARVVQKKCHNCGGPEVLMPGTQIVWQTVTGVRLCAKCHLRYGDIRRRRIEQEQRQDLDTLYAETHRP